MENNKRNNGLLTKGISKRTAIIGFALLLFLGGIIIFSDITKPHTFHDGDIISAGQVNENFDRLYAKVNELEDLMNPGGGAVIPTGTIMPFGGDADKVPEGWLLCDGKAYSSDSNSKYYNLFIIIGGNFGYPSPGEFYVPDLRGMFLRGVDNGKGVDPDAGSRTTLQSGGSTGDKVGSYQLDELKEHKHGVGGSKIAGSGDTRHELDDSAANNNYTAPTGGSETRPKNVYVHFIIKY